jgi:signal transduction histidine kinase
MTALAWIIAAVAALVAVAALAALARSRRRSPPAPAPVVLPPSAQAAELRRQATLNHLPTVALHVDQDCRLVEANQAALRRFPFLRPGMGLLEAFSEHELAGRVAGAIGAREAASFEVRLFAGGRRTYQVAVAPYALGDAVEALVLLADATEAVAYQELRSQFVANVSHELRTPLTGLRGLLEALDDPAMDPETRVGFVGRARRETERLEALISDILFLSELEATHGLPSSGRSDLSAATLAAAERLEGAAVEYGVDVEVLASRPAWTPLTERMAGTVVQNLLENAIKYAGPGAHAVVSVSPQGGEVVLEVADDGAGIPERHLPHVFERFYRADPSRSKRLGGTGLGLSIVKHIAERFEGRAEAESRLGFGTTVRVTLPRLPPPDDEAQEPSRPAVPTEGRAVD